jgi:copper chaperone CopZ
VREVLSEVDGVSHVETYLEEQEARVTYDPRKTRPEVLAKILTDYQGSHDFTAVVKQ